MRKVFVVLALTVALVAGIVPASAQVPGPGGPFNSGFTIQNLEAQSATCVYSLYNASGAASFTSTNLTVPGNGSLFQYVGGLSVASGQYSAVISCDRQVAAVANTTGSANASSYSGIGTAQASNISYAPGIYKNYYGYYSNIVAQNTSGAAVNITVDIFAAGSSTPAVSVTKSSVPANSSANFDLNGTDFAALAQGAYSAKISATGGALLATEVNIWNNVGQLFAYNPFGSGAAVAYAPVLMKNYYGFNTALTVQNLGTSPQAVTVTYSNGASKSATIAANSSAIFYTPNDVTANGQYSAKVDAPGGNVVALVNESSTTNRAASYEGFKTGSTKANAPIVLRKYYSYSTSVTCQNIGSGSTNITVNYSNGATETKSGIAVNGSALFFQPNTVGLADGFNGSATITAGQNIVCVVNENQVDNAASQDWLLAYDAISQ